MNKITSVTTSTDKELSDIMSEVEKAKRMLPFVIDFCQVRAKTSRGYYLSLIENGFNEKQALYLTKNNE